MKELFTLRYTIIHTSVLLTLLFLLTSNAWETSSALSGDNNFAGDPILILVWGAFGVLFGIVSWYWFFGYIIFFSFVIDRPIWEQHILKPTIIIIFFALCALTLFMGIQVGDIAIGDIDCACNYISSLDKGYYLFHALMGYLIAVVILLSIPMKVNSSTVLVAGLSFIYTFLIVLIKF